MLDPQGGDGVLEGTDGAKVFPSELIGHIGLHKHFSEREIEEKGRNHSGVGATQPKKGGLLISSENLLRWEPLGIAAEKIFGQGRESHFSSLLKLADFGVGIVLFSHFFSPSQIGKFDDKAHALDNPSQFFDQGSCAEHGAPRGQEVIHHDHFVSLA